LWKEIFKNCCGKICGNFLCASFHTENLLKAIVPVKILSSIVKGVFPGLCTMELASLLASY
jgi:hypothetical protein